MALLDEALLLPLGIFAYLIGSIPTSVWYGKLAYKTDVRQHGSGNPGATNTFRVLGKKAGTIVLLADVAKGMAAASLVWLALPAISGEESFVLQLLFGVLAVLGHVFSIFLRFKGGKGIATLLGVITVLQWQLALICLVVFLVTLLISKYVSLASILATVAYAASPFIFPFINTPHTWHIYLGWVFLIFVTFTHRKNIIRLLQGTENKTFLIKKLNKQQTS